MSLLSVLRTPRAPTRLNVGYIEMSAGGVTVRVYYDATAPVGDSQPLADGPRGYCLDVSGPAGNTATVTMAGLSTEPGAGDPVLASQTAAQLAALGATTRGAITASAT